MESPSLLEQGKNAQPIERRDGVTPTEKYLKKICEKTFLSLWSYSGLYKDQGFQPGKGGKEICDLLVVFGNNIIIFSDKDCKFPDSKNLETDWRRWFKPAIMKSARQAWGAERWIKKFPNRIFLDNKCTKPFPFDLPKMSDAEFHLVVVAHDVARRCAQDMGGSGSLMLNSEIKGMESHLMPYVIGDLDPAKTFVHVLDDTSLEIVVNENDTISDFVSYLKKKEALLRGPAAIMAAGEEELLAHYLKNMNEEEEHDFILPKEADYIAWGEGEWENFKTNPQRLRKIEANKVSYVWDHLIETFNEHTLAGTHLYVEESEGAKGSEKIMRFLAKEPRVSRRMLGAAFMDLLARTSKSKRATRYIQPTKAGEPYYILLLLPRFDFVIDTEYREVRKHFLITCMKALKLKFPDARDIVGIATESGISNPSRSEDAVYFDAVSWVPSKREEAEILEAKRNLGILERINSYNVYVNEYPESTDRPLNMIPFIIPKNPRNKPCPCKSEKKYKHCHGR